MKEALINVIKKFTDNSGDSVNDQGSVNEDDIEENDDFTI